MRIAIIAEGYFPEISGVTVSLHQRLKYFSQWGYEVRVYVPDYKQLSNIYPNYRSYLGEIMPGINIVPFPSQKFYVDYTLDPKAFSIRQVEKDIEQFHPDVIHLECAERLFMGFVGRVGVALAHRDKIPTSAIYHTNYLEYIEDFKKQFAWMRIPGVVSFLRHMFAWVYNSYDITMVPTPTIRDYLTSWGFRKTVVDSFYGIDSEAFKPLPGRGKNGKVNILYVGRFTADKQIDTLLDALTQAATNCKDLCFTLVGDGPEREKILAWSQKHPDTQLPGRIPPEKLPEYYQMADIFVTASTRENRPLTIQEAMACGLSVVAPARGGIVDQIDHGKTGWLVNPGNSQDLASAICQLVNNSKLRDELGRNARQKTETMHTWEYSSRAMIKIWENLIAEKSALRQKDGA